MKIVKPALHTWKVLLREAFQIQDDLTQKVLVSELKEPVKVIAGADISLDLKLGNGIAGVIVYSFPELKELERKSFVGKLSFPYIPGLLAFREGPILLEAFCKLEHEPDLIFFDGQGIAHPRRLGIASHLGLWLDKPTIGCAKSRLFGQFIEPPPQKGNFSELKSKKEIIGAVLRTKDNVNPIFVSPGHKVDLENAINFTLACCDGYRIPKPTREADKYVGSLAKLTRLESTSNDFFYPGSE